MKRSVYLLLLTFAGCSAHAPEMRIDVKLSDSDHAISISGLDKAVIDDISRDTTAGIWQNLLPVYKMPGDTDMKDFQQAQPGKYMLKDNTVVFIPDTPFKKGQVYFLRYFDYQGEKSAWQIVKDKQRLGAAKHRDMAFSY
jgi:hypothetical protein